MDGLGKSGEKGHRELESNLYFDNRTVFATEHSSGGYFAQFLGCRRGNVLRAIGPVAGYVADYENCIGQVAGIQLHGRNDKNVPIGVTHLAKEYWKTINSCSKEEASEGVDPACNAYVGCDADFPVQYCEHNEGHRWPDFASDAIWTFFKSLAPAVPSDEIGSGDVEDLGVISFKVSLILLILRKNTSCLDLLKSL